MEGTLVKRSGKIAFYGVIGLLDAIVFHRMTGFTDMSTSKNPKEYSRQYIDEEFEQSDVVGYSPSISYGLDMYEGNEVHEDIAKISDDELTGTDAVREIVIMDMNAVGENAIKRDFAVIPDSEGDGTDAYTYKGNFKVKGNKVRGTATVNAETGILTFVATP